MEYRIKMRYHWWFDNGLVGLYHIARGLAKNYDIHIITEDDGLLFKYDSEENLTQLLRASYEHMGNRYYNVSSKAQKEKCDYVAYNKEKDEVYALPKIQPIQPIASLISGKSYKDSSELYESLDYGLKERIDDYITKHNKSLYVKKKVLTGRTYCHDDKLLINPKSNKQNKTCSICGKKVDKLIDMNQLIYILTASKSASLSFHSNVSQKSIDKVCWECSYLGRFVYEAFHIKNTFRNKSKQVMLMSLYTSNFNQLLDVHDHMGGQSTLREISDDSFISNIKGQLINYARTNSELLWAMIVDKYQVLRDECIEDDEERFEEEVLRGYILRPIQIMMLFLSDKGQTLLARDRIIYNDTSYMFRLIHMLHEQGIELDSLFMDLHESYKENADNLLRSKILSKCLYKQSVLLHLEQLCFQKVMRQRSINIRNMIEFVKLYELNIREDVMNKEQIEVAVKLGKQIVLQATESHQKNDSLGILKKIKGDLFTLRKTRTVTDFLKQINTLQFRYNISVNNAISEGVLNDVPFEEFKAYCIMGALNVYNMKQKKGGKEDE
ncbi:hypothetical protein HZI73_17495 [Vallitalea pronyensis]|uniref:Uncharacterized protein n=1 Tax=Vallitalea pronyensis TaxID=1348613 RepID=A0A8J8MLZ4_9FIRM|nr:hypothetical protein [Vallitalea pronyensis]QUI23979.1 hypothetical protein HZI73_17495 [Vallitalea pronyensis]